jgi:hypothetical protein
MKEARQRETGARPHCLNCGQWAPRPPRWLGMPTRYPTAGGPMGSLLRRLCITSFGAPTSTRINYFLATGGGPGADTMRSATLAAMGWSLLLTGCANGWFPSPNLPTALFTGSAPSPASSAPSRAADCSAKMSSPFGTGVDTSSLSAVLDDSARAAQSCGWEKGTRVSYGSPPATTAALAERK